MVCLIISLFKIQYGNLFLTRNGVYAVLSYLKYAGLPEVRLSCWDMNDFMYVLRLWFVSVKWVRWGSAHHHYVHFLNCILWTEIHSTPLFYQKIWYFLSKNATSIKKKEVDGFHAHIGCVQIDWFGSKRREHKHNKFLRGIAPQVF